VRRRYIRWRQNLRPPGIAMHRLPRLAPRRAHHSPPTAGTPSWASLIPAPKYGRKRRASGPPAPDRPEQAPPKPRPSPSEPPRPPRPAKAAAKPAKRVDASKPRFGHLNTAHVEEIRQRLPEAPRAVTARDIRRATAECTRPADAIRPPEGSVAGQVLAAAEKAAVRTRSILPPVGSTARAVLNAGRRARGQEPLPE
jgi:hypothetical protein